MTGSSVTLEQPRIVVADARVQFGRPVLVGTGVPTAILLERYLAGDSVDELAEDYRCDRLKIEEAIRCEHRHACGSSRSVRRLRTIHGSSPVCPVRPERRAAESGLSRWRMCIEERQVIGGHG